MNPENLCSSFPHPDCSEHTIGVVFDVCHMLKLARNLLAEHQEIIIPDVGRTKWQLFEQLCKTQSSEGLRLGNKLTSAHIHFKMQKMKVRLAWQLYSQSNARALQYLRVEGYTGFQDTVSPPRSCVRC